MLVPPRLQGLAREGHRRKRRAELPVAVMAAMAVVAVSPAEESASLSPQDSLAGLPGSEALSPDTSTLASAMTGRVWLIQGLEATR